MSEWVRSEKNKSFGRNNKIKHYFYLICLLASLLPAHARPISDMKSQPGLFVSSIPCERPPWNSIPWKSMDIYGNPLEFHGNRWKSMEFHGTSMDGVSMEFHRMPWSSMEYPWGSMECHGFPWSIDGVPWNAMKFHGVSLEVHGIPRNIYRGVPWNAIMGFPEVPMEFHGMP